MRRVVCLAVVLALAAAGPARAEEKADCKAIIAKAIKAAGGEEKLAKIKAYTVKMKGKYYGMGEGFPYTGELAVQLPDKHRIQIDGEIGGEVVTFFIQAVNGDKIWRKEGENKPQEVADKDKIAEVKEERHAEKVVSLLPLIKEKEYNLDTLGEVKVDGKSAVGVRVSRKGHRDVNLFFDKDNGLLVKNERSVKDEATDKEVVQETIYSDYQEVNGTKQAMKVVINRDGKKYVDGTLSDFEVKDAIDDAVFGKP
jgi:hypothetical protein